MSSSLRAQLEVPPVPAFDLDALGSAGPLMPAGSLEEVSLRLHLTEHCLARMGSSRAVVRVLGDLIREVTLETWSSRSSSRSKSSEESGVTAEACFEDAVGIGEDLGAVLALLVGLGRVSSSGAGHLEPTLAAQLSGWALRLRALLARMVRALEAESPVELDESAWEEALGAPLGAERGLLRFSRPEDAGEWVWRECFLQSYYPPLLQGIFRASGRQLLEIVGPEHPRLDQRLRIVARDLGMTYQALAFLVDGLATDGQTRAEGLLLEAATSWCRELLELLQDLGAALGADTAAGPEEAG